MPANLPSEPSVWTLFDRVFDAVMIVDRDGRIQYANASFCALTGLSPEQLDMRTHAKELIELPEECWSSSGSAKSIEAGFITKSGAMGRAKISTSAITVDGFTGVEHACIVLRDVSAEDRLGARNKVLIETNEHLTQVCERIGEETSFLRSITRKLPSYSDKSTMLNTLVSRLKADMGCRDAHFFHVSEDGQGIETVSVERRLDSRAKDVIRQLEPILRDHRGELVRSAMLEPYGQVWIAFCKPLLERTIVMVIAPRASMKPAELRPFLESLANELAARVDSHALFFQSLHDPVSGLFDRRFFDSRLRIECQRAGDKQTALSLMLLELESADDATFASVGRAIQRRIRGADFVARVGERRFGVLLPETSASDALIVAESIRNMTAVKPTVIRCGIAAYRFTTDSPESFFTSAEHALADAKVAPPKSSAA